MTAKVLACSVAIVLASVFGFSSIASATATVVINNTDGAGEGFNDPTIQPASPTNGCNAGETLGTCRLRVFTTAAAQWGQLLNSTVTITVDAGMNPLTCSGTSAVLGSAGPQTAHANFPNAPRAGTAYVQALANSLAGSDLGAANDDITANFNIDLDNGTCLTGTTGWWYGTNGSVPAPNDRTPLLPVVFHEIGHGLGFTSLYSSTSGAPSTGAGIPIWGYYLYNTANSKLWKDMTNAERVSSAIGDPTLVWTGPRTNKQSEKFLGPPATVLVNSPAGIAGYNNAQTAEFGANVATNPVTGNVVYVNDGVTGPVDGTHPTAGTVNDGCETYPAPITGQIALVDRGYCTFVIKALNAQAAGAIGLVVANNVASGLPGMGGADATITVASLGVTQALGTSMKANLPAPGVNVTMGIQTGAALAGTTSGCVRMFAPNPVQSGSSVSHFHSDSFPNLLMEPALNRSIFNKVDLTLPLFQDIGWNMTPENILFIDGFENNPCQFVQP
jgi:hypothetical protein